MSDPFLDRAASELGATINNDEIATRLDAIIERLDGLETALVLLVEGLKAGALQPPASSNSPFAGGSAAPGTPEPATVKLGFYAWHQDSKGIVTLALYTAGGDVGKNKYPTLTIQSKVGDNLPRWVFIKKIESDTQSNFAQTPDWGQYQTAQGQETWKSPALENRAALPACIARLGMVLELRTMKKINAKGYAEYTVEDFAQAPLVSAWGQPAAPAPSQPDDDMPF